MDTLMTVAYSRLRISVLIVWLLSMVLWAYVVVKVFTGGCSCDLYAPLINGVPFPNLWETGFIAFVAGFTSLTMYLAYWGRDSSERPLTTRFLRALLQTTSLYSMLVFIYLAAEVLVYQAPLNSPFIDVLLPWFTFIRLGVLALVLSLASFLAYLIFFWRLDRGSTARRLG